LMGLAYIGYRAVKSWMVQGPSATDDTADGTAGEIDDVMVKDPFCETYIPKRDGIQLTRNGNTLYFCSVECRDKYIEENGI